LCLAESKSEIAEQSPPPLEPSIAASAAVIRMNEMSVVLMPQLNDRFVSWLRRGVLGLVVFMQGSFR
jgi:hypothetical protein